MHLFALGAVAMGFFVAGTFFLRFWRETRDTLFLLFATAFWIEAANRTVLAALGGPSEGRPLLYAMRILAYLLIIAGIVVKNLPRKPPDAP